MWFYSIINGVCRYMHTNVSFLFQEPWLISLNRKHQMLHVRDAMSVCWALLEKILLLSQTNMQSGLVDQQCTFSGYRYGCGEKEEDQGVKKWRNTDNFFCCEETGRTSSQSDSSVCTAISTWLNTLSFHMNKAQQTTHSVWSSCNKKKLGGSKRANEVGLMKQQLNSFIM